MAVFALLPEPGVTKAKFDQIQLGMSEADAAAIFGQASTRTLTIVDNGSASTIIFDAGKGCAFIGADGDAMILLDADGRIYRATWIDHERTLFEKMRDWLRISR